MKRIVEAVCHSGRRSGSALAGIAVLTVCLAPAFAQKRASNVPALLVSDVHFDPFWDPGKAAQLAAAPASGWRSILESPPSPDREQRFSVLEKSCHMRGDDTSFPLFESALSAMKERAGRAHFVTVSGDLIAHEFDCRYKSLFPGAGPADYRAFVEKTIALVAGELDRVAPQAPVFIALGNNDSDCGDYQLDEDGSFLSDIGPLLLRGVPERERAEAMESFRKGGYYTVSLPAPVERTRLVVLNDIFLSPWYKSCAGKPDPAAGNAELDWLAQQRARAHAAHERVWVMGHIPPGVDSYSTLAHEGAKCDAKPPVMFLATDKLAQELTAGGRDIRLGIFAHAHTDEFKLLQPELDAAAPDQPAASGAKAEEAAVAIKMVPSISPINGNNPAFTIAQVNPSTARLADYRVFAAGNPQGSGQWRELYDFDLAYHRKSFSPVAVRSILARFSSDPEMKTTASQAYVRNFLTGQPDVLLPMVWPRYVCTLSQATASDYARCACQSAEQSGSEGR